MLFLRELLARWAIVVVCGLRTPHGSLFRVSIVLYCEGWAGQRGILVDVDVGWYRHGELAEGACDLYRGHGLHAGCSCAC